jgi:hypothetical protein
MQDEAGKHHKPATPSMYRYKDMTICLLGAKGLTQGP